MPWICAFEPAVSTTETSKQLLGRRAFSPSSSWTTHLPLSRSSILSVQVVWLYLSADDETRPEIVARQPSRRSAAQALGSATGISASSLVSASPSSSLEAEVTVSPSSEDSRSPNIDKGTRYFASSRARTAGCTSSMAFVSSGPSSSTSPSASALASGRTSSIGGAEAAADEKPAATSGLLRPGAKLPGPGVTSGMTSSGLTVAAGAGAADGSGKLPVLGSQGGGCAPGLFCLTAVQDTFSIH
mmetsp:Transcript_88112/g.275934  ORF Transcript_88112/g.275934 Transcript_88112/m.275934 type:complete len:243 (-) Transcript_88112:1278-2006(-)